MRWSTIRIAGAVALLVASCATAPPSQELSSLLPARDATARVAGPWSHTSDAIVNTVPGDASIEPGQVRDGTGISVGLLPDFTAQDVILEGEVSFSGQGAPALLFRAQERDGVVTAMYTVALYRNGVNLWRLSNQRWQLIRAQVMRLDEDNTYSLHVEARGDTISARLNESALFNAKDTGLVAPGRVGVRGAEGPCRFYALRAREK